MSESKQDEGLRMLQDEHVDKFNKWRMNNLSLKLKFDGKDFSNRDISNAYLNGISFINSDFSNSKLRSANLVQSNLSDSKFDGADLANTLMMYAILRNSFLTQSNLDNTNFMCA